MNEQFACERCLYVIREGLDYECRRHAPAPVISAHGITEANPEGGPLFLIDAAWPHVSPDDWCGEWRPVS